MANGTSRQQPTSTPASQARRSTRLSLRNSIVGPGRTLRQPSNRRSSRLIDPSLIDNFNWGDEFDLDRFGADNKPQNGDELTFDEFDFEDLNPDYASGQAPNGLAGGHVSTNYYDNPGVAVPGTPRTMSFPFANQQMGLPMAHRQATVPLTPVVINGHTMLLSQDQVNAMNTALAGPQAMLTDGKRTSVPKSPQLRKHRHSQLQGQVAYNDPFVGAEHVDPALLEFSAHDYSTYPEPNAQHGSFAAVHPPQPYYQPTHWQGVPSPGGRRLHFQPPEPEYVQPAPQQKVSEPAQDFGFPDWFANENQSGSTTTYASRNNSSGHGRRDSPVNPKKSYRQDKAHVADKRVSVFDRDAIHQYQKPKVAAFNPEVRINKTTKGLTTRTAKINQYDPRKFYTYSPHPLGTPGQPHGAPWHGRYEHKYRDSSLKEYEGDDEVAIYELENRAMTTDQIQDFILNYPSSRNILTLRIQIQPGDSGRRYRGNADKCRFEECPLRQGQLPATIKHGWYRVAFDERNDDTYDPFAACCGFAHLYCMERFLDFEYICRKANVVVDFRSHMRGEPKGTFAAAFQGKQNYAGQLADTFIHFAREKAQGNVPRQRGDKSGVRQISEFANYPVHEPYSQMVWDPSYAFENTLSYHMMLIMEAHRPAAQLTQFAGKGLGPSQMSVNRGDLAMAAEADIREKNLKKMNKAKGKKKGKNVAETYAFDGYSMFDIEVRRRVERAELVLQQKGLLKRTDNKPTFEDYEDDEEQNVPLNQTGKKPWEVDDDESDVEDIGRPFQTGTRRSERNAGKQPNYLDQADIGRDHERQPGRPLKRSFQQYEYSQHNTGQAQQYLQNTYVPSGYAQDFVEEHVPKRKRSSIPPSGYARAHSYRPEPTPELAGHDYQVGLDHLGLDINLAPSPRSPEFQRKRSSRIEELLQQQLSGSSKRRLSSNAGPARSNSIMRHSGSRAPSATKRRASFNSQPVSQQKMFNSDAPPHNVQPRMVKELEGDSHSLRSSKKGDYAGRTLRSGRSLGGSTSE
ncbi:uncharacterized protein N0V89_000900 [Didymosphaeria variabile]|uniref:Uncharacterized protein n=1 Tax=Didymosphaeria variabile TaxID=1932322 RepID=A0A9W8XW30_9PLEO|nr:uncharacterized protein N0V89_000900 [Didymosphaeria variabile]KAJ4360338.1 hypothetical protein N0V89_000900 [Didymosphaeria variabile]